MRYVLCFIACFLSATSNAAEPGIRYATIFEQSVNGAASKEATAENMLTKALIQAGATVIKPNAGRAKLYARDLVAGEISDEITALDADVIIAATVGARPDKAGSLFVERPELGRYRASLEAVMIAVDTKEVLETFSLEGVGIETDPNRAIQIAFERAGTSLAKHILESTNRISRRLEIVVEGMPATSGEKLKDALLTLAGAKSAKIVFASAETSKAVLFLDPSAPSAPELARAIDRMPDAGLVVTGFSERTINARYSMTRAVRIPIVFSRFSGKASARGAEIARYIGDALLAQGSLAPTHDKPIELANATKQREGQLARLGLLEQDALFLSGRYVERNAHFEIQAEVRSTRPGFDLLVRDHGLCPKDQLLTCSSEIAKRLLVNLPGALTDRRTEGTTRATENVAIKQINIEPELFPARAGAYRTKGVGRMTIENRSKVSATGGRLRIYIPQLMASPAVTQAPSIAAGGTVEVPIVLDVREDPQASPNAKLELSLDYEVAGRREKMDRLIDVPVLERYALDWREPESIADFVTERAPSISDLAARAIKAIPANNAKEPFARPAALFHAMARVSYQRDPAHAGRPDELDDVKMPVETLARGYGDCEDLAVLYASLLESAGARALLILTPGHVLAAVDSEVPAQSAALGLDPKRVIVHKGRAFIPVETTRAGSSFAEAWSDGAKLLARVAEEGLELRIIDVRDAHLAFPGVSFKIEAAPPQEPASWEKLAKDLQTIAKERDAAYQQALREERGVREYGAQAASRRAMLLSAVGRGAEAQRLLEETSARFPENVALKNNSANIRLATGDAGAALALYDAALAKAKDPKTRVRVFLNAAIAARVKGNTELCHQHAIDALGHAKTPELRAIVTDFVAGLGDGGLVPGTEGASFDRVAFGVRLKRALEVNRSTPRGNNAVSTVRLAPADLVYWLDSEEAAQ
jgi:hypothetical protein